MVNNVFRGVLSFHLRPELWLRRPTPLFADSLHPWFSVVFTSDEQVAKSSARLLLFLRKLLPSTGEVFVGGSSPPGAPDYYGSAV